MKGAGWLAELEYVQALSSAKIMESPVAPHPTRETIACEKRRPNMPFKIVPTKGGSSMIRSRMSMVSSPLSAVRCYFSALSRPSTALSRGGCHSERSEESRSVSAFPHAQNQSEIPRWARNDISHRDTAGTTDDHNFIVSMSSMLSESRFR